VGGGQREVAAHGDEDVDVTGAHGLDGGDGVEAVVTGWLDVAGGGESVEEVGGGAVVDAAGAVALDVAVAPDRGRARTLAAQVAAQQQQVDDLADGVDAVFVLGDAQTPADDAAVGFPVDAGGGGDLGAGQAGLAFQVVPGRRRALRAVVVEAGG